MNGVTAICSVMEIKTYDHPEANGRKPQPGESEWNFSFRSETGETVTVKMGPSAWENHSQHVLDMLTEAPGYNEGTLGQSDS